MKVLWLCNFMLPMVAEKLGREATNKEGWISGLASVLLARQQENGLLFLPTQATAKRLFTSILLITRTQFSTQERA